MKLHPLLSLIFITFLLLHVSTSAQESIILKDYESGLAEARKLNKPMLLVFTGLGCTNNIDLQSKILKDRRLSSFLKQHFVQVWLYVDDRTPLKEPEIMNYNGNAVQITRLGQKWSRLQQEMFHENSQPFIAVLSPNGDVIGEPTLYSDITLPLKEYLSKALNEYQHPN